MLITTRWTGRPTRSPILLVWQLGCFTRYRWRHGNWLSWRIYRTVSGPFSSFAGFSWRWRRRCSRPVHGWTPWSWKRTDGFLRRFSGGLCRLTSASKMSDVSWHSDGWTPWSILFCSSFALTEDFCFRSGSFQFAGFGAWYTFSLSWWTTWGFDLLLRWIT